MCAVLIPVASISPNNRDCDIHPGHVIPFSLIKTFLNSRSREIRLNPTVRATLSRKEPRNKPIPPYTAYIAHNSAILWPPASSGPRPVVGRKKTDGMYNRPMNTATIADARMKTVLPNLVRIMELIHSFYLRITKSRGFVRSLKESSLTFSNKDSISPVLFNSPTICSRKFPFLSMRNVAGKLNTFYFFPTLIVGSRKV